MTNEKRLIDANALTDEFLRHYTEQEKKGNLSFVACEIKQGFADMVNETPTVDAVELPNGKPGDYLEWDNGTGFKQIYHIHSVMICEDCMRYELEKFAPVVNHPGIVRIMSREEAEKEWHERCARERTQEEPTLTADEIDFDYEAEV